MQVVVLVPTYNEERAIQRVVNGAGAVLERLASTWDVTIDHDIIVVDDGSKDGTREILDFLDVRRFYHRKNLGKGDAIKHATTFISNREIVVLMDGDGEHDPRDLPALLEPILQGRADMVIGSRFVGRGRHHRTTYLGRAKQGRFFNNLGNRLFTTLLWIFTREAVTDTQSGFRAFAPGVLRFIKPSADGFRIEMEMTVKAIKRGFTIVEVPVNNGHGARASHLNPVLDGAKIALTVFRECLPRRTTWFFDWLLPLLPKRIGRLIG